MSKILRLRFFKQLLLASSCFCFFSVPFTSLGSEQLCQPNRFWWWSDLETAFVLDACPCRGVARWLRVLAWTSYSPHGVFSNFLIKGVSVETDHGGNGDKNWNCFRKSTKSHLMKLIFGIRNFKGESPIAILAIFVFCRSSTDRRFRVIRVLTCSHDTSFAYSSFGQR